MGKRWHRWDTGIRMLAYKGDGETNMGGICHQMGEHDMITSSDEKMGFNAGQNVSHVRERGTPPHWNPLQQLRHSMTQFDTLRWEWNGVLCDTSNVLSYFFGTSPKSQFLVSFTYCSICVSSDCKSDQRTFPMELIFGFTLEGRLWPYLKQQFKNTCNILRKGKASFDIGRRERGGWWHDKQFHHLTLRCYHRIRSFSTFLYQSLFEEC